MEFKTTATGDQRKKLVTEISTYLNLAAHYEKAPGFSYTVGDYRIDKTGTVSGPYDRKLLDALAEHGFSGEIIGSEEPQSESNGLPVVEEQPQSNGAETAEMETTLEQHLCDQSEHCSEDETRLCGDSDSDTITIEAPMDGFSPESLDNLCKFIVSKEALIKKAIGADSLPVKQTNNGTLSFEWFPFTQDADEVNAYSTLICKLCEAAKTQKRVTAKAREVENEKFAMRVFLIRLGFVGDEYKTARKILLRNLSGNSSWKHLQTYTACCYTYPNGSEEDAMDCETAEFISLTKAKAHVDEFAASIGGIYFAGAHVEDENGKYVYELLCD